MVARLAHSLVLMDHLVRQWHRFLRTCVTKYLSTVSEKEKEKVGQFNNLLNIYLTTTYILHTVKLEFLGILIFVCQP